MEFSIKCPRCDRPVPIDGPMELIHCDYCQTDIPVAREYLVETLSEACSDMQKTDIGTGSGTMLLGTFSGNLTLARFNPYCVQCKTDFASPWSLRAGSSYSCAKCGATYPVDSPPAFLKDELPGIRYLINALLSSDTSSASSSGSFPVALACPSCGASLTVDGTTRFVDCNYCNTQVYLPDNLWLRFHSVRKKRRWFVVCEYA